MTEAAVNDTGWLRVGRDRRHPEENQRENRGCCLARRTRLRCSGYDGKAVGVIANVCAHQNGPLGEGRIIDGCVTCPWHGLSVPPGRRLRARALHGQSADLYGLRLDGDAIVGFATAALPLWHLS